MEELVKLPNEKLMELFRARVKRKFRSGVGHRFTNLIKKVCSIKYNHDRSEYPKPTYYLERNLNLSRLIKEMVLSCQKWSGLLSVFTVVEVSVTLKSNST